MNAQTNSSAPLLPCPFCGSQARLSKSFGNENDGYCQKVVVTCPDCNAELERKGAITAKSPYADNSTVLERACAAWNMRHTAPQAQPADADEWYLQDTRSHVGNDVLWWAKDGKGYTTDLRNAHVFTREAAIRQAETRDCDRPWPKAYIDGKARPAVDMQYIDHDAAMAWKSS